MSYNLPPADCLLTVTAAQWDKYSNAPAWVVNGKLTAAAPVIVPDVDVLRAAKLAQINAWRDEQERGTVMYGDHKFDADQSARDRIIPVVMVGMMPLPFWTDADNIDRPMTIKDMQGLLGAILEQGAKIHARQRQMKEAVATMDADELAAFVPGWGDIAA